jgi:hypothetical protein
MTNSASASHLEPRFNDFLFARIGEDSNGMALSVLSALARRDVDPWDEAAKLAALPGETAIERLVSLITPLPDGPAAKLDPEAIAARLIALLPPHAVSGSLARAKDAALSGGERWWPVIYFGIVVLIMSAQILMARRQSTEGPARASPHASVTIPQGARRLDSVDSVSRPQVDATDTGL